MDEKTAKKLKNKKSKKAAAFIVIFLLILFIICDFFFIAKKSKVFAPITNNNNSTDLIKEEVNTQQTQNDYYADGLSKYNEKKYEEAVESFSKAIELDKSNSDLYARKSEAEYALGDKESALETVKEGISIDPDNELLQAKLDTLSKDYFSTDASKPE